MIGFTEPRLRATYRNTKSAAHDAPFYDVREKLGIDIGGPRAARWSTTPRFAAISYGAGGC